MEGGNFTYLPPPMRQNPRAKRFTVVYRRFGRIRRRCVRTRRADGTGKKPFFSLFCFVSARPDTKEARAHIHTHTRARTGIIPLYLLTRAMSNGIVWGPTNPPYSYTRAHAHILYRYLRARASVCACQRPRYGQIVSSHYIVRAWEGRTT